MTADGVLGVSPDELQRVSSSMEALADELASRLQTIDDRVSGFVGTGWTGVSSGAFAESFWQWHQGAQEVYAGLAEMSALLDSAAGRYQRRDDRSASSLSTHMNAGL